MRAARARDGHQRIEHRGRRFLRRARVPVAARFEADAIHAAIHHRLAEDLRDLIAHRRILRHVDDFAAEALRLREALRNQIADDDDRRAQQLAGRRRGQTHRAGAGDVDRRARSDTRRDRAVIAGREDVGKAGQALDLRHRLRLIRELQKVQVRVGNHHVFRLAADPAAHIDVAVSRARPRRIHVQADAGLAFLAIAAASAGDVERNGAEVADFDELDVAARFDHFAGDFMAENQAMRRRRAPSAPCADRFRRYSS